MKQQLTQSTVINVKRGSAFLINPLFLPAMLANKSGIIINIASTAAFQPLPYMSNYGASKVFVLNFTEALWAEYVKEGIQFLSVCPGPTDTHFFTAMNRKPMNFGKLRISQRLL